MEEVLDQTHRQAMELVVSQYCEYWKLIGSQREIMQRLHRHHV